MKKNCYLLLACLAVLLSSCAAYRQTAPVIGYEHNYISTNVSADLDLENAQKVDATIETKTLFGFIALKRNGHKYLKSSTFYRGIGKRESQALYKAKEKSGADIILSPEFASEKHSWFFGAYKTTTTKVSGWAVNVKGLKQTK